MAGFALTLGQIGYLVAIDIKTACFAKTFEKTKKEKTQSQFLRKLKRTHQVN